MSVNQVAYTILQQLGGNKFIAMTGAKNFLGDERTLWFSLPERFAKDGINRVKVVLTWDDLYDLEFGKYKRNRTYEVKVKYAGIYFDQLQELFTQATGLDTHL